MFSTRFFILIMSLLSLIYDVLLSRMADIQRKKPLPEEVADVYDKERYQTYLDYVADRKKVSNKYKLINIVIDVILIFSPMYHYIDEWCQHNPYLVFLITYLIIWVIGTIVGVIASYEITFGIMERYKLNKKDKKEFAKDEILENAFEVVMMLALGELIVFIGEHLPIWTNNFSIGYGKSLLVCLVIFAVVLIFFAMAQLISYFVMKKQYVFTPMEEGELKEKINALQETSRKKVKHIYIYNESKKTTMKNAFLLKLFWHREFGIADNFMNENAEDELLAVLSHEIGHLKHKKNVLNFLGYAIIGVLACLLIYLIVNPEICLVLIKWVRDSFHITSNNYYLLLIVFGDVLKPILAGVNIFSAYRSRCEEYEADREAVKNGYGEALIRTFKNMSSDELINVNPHPFIEFVEYDHPGMYRRIKAIHEAEVKK